MIPRFVLIGICSWIFTLGMSWAALAYSVATDDTPRPKPRPQMDCWVTENGGTDCRFIE